MSKGFKKLSNSIQKSEQKVRILKTEIMLYTPMTFTDVEDKKVLSDLGLLLGNITLDELAILAQFVQKTEMKSQAIAYIKANL
jgi:hypothetical protein